MEVTWWHWYYTVEKTYKGRRYQVARMLIPSNWYRVRKYAKEVLKA